MALSNDAAALAFGKQIIRDLMHSDSEQYTGWIMDITEGERSVVGSIRCGVDAGRDQKK